MRQDQFERLQGLTEKLADVFLVEADPDRWPGAGIEPANMDRDTRGDRYWSKKNAVATISLIQRVINLQGSIRLGAQGGGDEPTAPETEDIDKQIAAHEKEAAALLNEIQRATRKANFDRKVHGKP